MSGKQIPELGSNAEAEEFVAGADLTAHDLSERMRFEFAPKTERVNMHLPTGLLEAVNATAARHPVPALYPAGAGGSRGAAGRFVTEVKGGFCGETTRRCMRQYPRRLAPCPAGQRLRRPRQQPEGGLARRPRDLPRRLRPL